MCCVSKLTEINVPASWNLGGLVHTDANWPSLSQEAFFSAPQSGKMHNPCYTCGDKVPLLKMIDNQLVKQQCNNFGTTSKSAITI